jgi:hypothetical protein
VLFPAPAGTKKRKPQETLSGSLLYLYIFCVFMQKISINGLLWEFARYKNSLCEFLYGFMREARQTSRGFGSNVRGLLRSHKGQGKILFSVIFVFYSALQPEQVGSRTDI